jgi:hypothetical protein
MWVSVVPVILVLDHQQGHTDTSLSCVIGHHVKTVCVIMVERSNIQAERHYARSCSIYFAEWSVTPCICAAYGYMSMIGTVKARKNESGCQADATNTSCLIFDGATSVQDRSSRVKNPWSNFRQSYLPMVVCQHCYLAKGTARNLLSPAFEGENIGSSI